MNGLKKLCPKCDGWFDYPEGYYRHRKNADGAVRFCSECKACHIKQVGAYNKANPAKRVEYLLQYNYGISTAEKEELLALQRGCCAICGIRVTMGVGPRNGGTKNSAVLDHDHELHRVRGVLCPLCNVGLGSFRDDTGLLQHAITYLEMHRVSV